ncbi:MAG TPA: T9SS type A sorting domain-containing protein [Puia sp.]|nr:T9SS type A sorting domain-containing protein [Puia sp.]
MIEAPIILEIPSEFNFNQINSSAQIYPFNEGFMVRLNSLQQSNGIVELRDSNGRLIHQEKVLVGIGENIYSIAGLSGLSRGVYVLHIANRSKNFTNKMIKE